jgi:hypothetical protein
MALDIKPNLNSFGDFRLRMAEMLGFAVAWPKA